MSVAITSCMVCVNSISGVFTGKSGSVVETHFGQTAQQLMTISSKQLRVQLAAGGDPTYAFNVKMVGEDVMGTSGSFRHFLWQAIHELHSTKLQILMSCPSSAAGINKVGYALCCCCCCCCCFHFISPSIKDKFILTPGPLTASLEKLLIFFGQVIDTNVHLLCWPSSSRLSSPPTSCWAWS